MGSGSAWLARAATVIAVGALCSVAAVTAGESTGRGAGLGESTTLETLLEGGVTALFVAVGFALLALASRWMSVAGSVATLAAMVALSGWVSIDMWNSSNALDGLMVLVLIVVLPPVAIAGALLDVGGRTLARRLRAAS